MTIKHAIRPFFAAAKSGTPLFYEQEVEFEWHSGMSWQVKQRSSDSFQSAILEKYSKSGLAPSELLEVSTASHNHETGQALSALNLMYEDEGTGIIRPVENWFQSAKVFTDSGQTFGPYKELLDRDKPKRYLNTRLDKKTKEQYANDDLFERIQLQIANATMCGFELHGETYPILPRSAFYDYLYVCALSQSRNKEIAQSLLGFRVFTDIMFTPGKGVRRKYNTQARSCAIYVALANRNLLDQALSGYKSFVETVGYPEEDAGLSNEEHGAGKQMELL